MAAEWHFGQDVSAQLPPSPDLGVEHSAHPRRSVRRGQGAGEGAGSPLHTHPCSAALGLCTSIARTGFFSRHPTNTCSLENAAVMVFFTRIEFRCSWGANPATRAPVHKATAEVNEIVARAELAKELALEEDSGTSKASISSL